MIRPTDVEHIVAPPRGESPAGAASSFFTCHPARLAAKAAILSAGVLFFLIIWGAN